MFWLCFQVTELDQRCSLFASSSRSRSSSVTSWDGLHGNAPVSSSCELTSRRYSAPMGQEEMQQELVVKAIRVKKKKRRRQGKAGSSHASLWLLPLHDSCDSEFMINV